MLAGGSLDFTAWFTVQTYAGTVSGGNPEEPAPSEGTQFWDIGWSLTQSELLDSVFLNAGGKDLLLHPAAFPGTAVSGSWDFSLTFATPGVYTIDLNGGWTTNTQQTTTSTTASRDCAYDDFGTLNCSPWSTTVVEETDDFFSMGGFDTRGIEITVLAVPEPATAALWMLGLGALAFARRRV